MGPALGRTGSGGHGDPYSCSTELRRSGSLVGSPSLESSTLGRLACPVCLWSTVQREPQWALSEARQARELGWGLATWSFLQVRTPGAGFVIWGHSHPHEGMAEGKVAATQSLQLVGILSGSEAPAGTRPTAPGGDAALLLFSSGILGKPLTFSQPVFSPGNGTNGRSTRPDIEGCGEVMCRLCRAQRLACPRSSTDSIYYCSFGVGTSQIFVQRSYLSEL